MTPPLSATRPLHPLYCNIADLSQWRLSWLRDPQAPSTISTEVGFKARQTRTLSSNTSVLFYTIDWPKLTAEFQITNTEPEVKQTALWLGISAKMGRFNCLKLITPETITLYRQVVMQLLPIRNWESICLICDNKQTGSTSLSFVLPTIYHQHPMPSVANATGDGEPPSQPELAEDLCVFVCVHVQEVRG